MSSVITCGINSEYSSKRVYCLCDSRDVCVGELPLIPHIKDCQRIFEWQDLTINNRVYFGLISSMLLMEINRIISCLYKKQCAYKYQKRRKARSLCRSFIHGDPNRLPPALIQFMSIVTGNLVAGLLVT